MRLCAIDGHPDVGRFSSALMEAYLEPIEGRPGVEIRRIALRDIDFDPVLHRGYSKRQDWEPGLAHVAESLEWCQHLVLAFPMWWGGQPALLKGVFDRILLPGVAFKHHENDPFWDRLLKGRSADTIITGDTPAWYLRFVYGNPVIRQMRGQVLDFCGFKPVRIRYLGPVRGQPDKRRMRYLAQARAFGQSAPKRGQPLSAP